MKIVLFLIFIFISSLNAVNTYDCAEAAERLSDEAETWSSYGDDVEIAFKKVEKVKSIYEYQCEGNYPLSTPIFCNKKNGHFFLNYEKALKYLKWIEDRFKDQYDEMRDALENANNNCS